uniref:MTMR6-9 GRAM domain-containing protein n=1 Tax=Fundulus heteroclitus TaxID=8078 RepID=A0A3Q2PSX0_FUNHE
MEHIRTPKVTDAPAVSAGAGPATLTRTTCVFQVLHSMVCGVERPPATPSGSPLVLRCKDFRVLQVLVPQERDCADVHASLVRLSRPGWYQNLPGPDAARQPDLLGSAGPDPQFFWVSEGPSRSEN